MAHLHLLQDDAQLLRWHLAGPLAAGLAGSLVVGAQVPRQHLAHQREILPLPVSRFRF
jgi:hypothetical protein